MKRSSNTFTQTARAIIAPRMGIVIRSRDRQGWRFAWRVFSMVLALSMLLNSVGFAMDGIAVPTSQIPEDVVGSTYVDHHVEEQETNLHDDDEDRGGRGADVEYVFAFQADVTVVLLSQLFALCHLPPERMQAVETVLYPGGEGPVDTADLLSVEPLMNENQKVFDYRITALQYFETAQLLVYLTDDVYTLNFTNLFGRVGIADPYGDDGYDETAPLETSDVEAPFSETEGDLPDTDAPIQEEIIIEEAPAIPEEYAIEEIAPEPEPQVPEVIEVPVEPEVVEIPVEPEVAPEVVEIPVEPETEPEVVETPVEPETAPEVVETPVEEPETAPEVVETPAEPETAPEVIETPAEPETEPEVAETPAEPETEPEVVETPAEPETEPEVIETPAEPETVPEVVETPAEEPETEPEIIETPVEPEAPEEESGASVSAKTEYLTLAAMDGEALPHIAPVDIATPDYMQAVEAYAIDGEESFGGIEVTLERMPELSEGEYLALYGLIDGELADAPILSDLSMGDSCAILSSGFALVRAGLTSNSQLPAQSMGRTLVELSGVLPVEGSASVEPNIGVENDGTLLAACDISVQDALGNDFQPLPDAPVEVTVRNEAIRAAIESGSELSVSQIADGLELDAGVEILSVSDDAVTFAAESLETYAVREVVLRKDQTVSDGSTYRITAIYDTASGIPADAELVVSEITEGDSDYADYVDKSAQTLEEAGQKVVHARAFDIALKNPATGEEYQPTKDVRISIELLDDSVNAYENVDVLHIHGEDQVDVLDASVNGEALEFDASGFSVFVVAFTEAITTRYIDAAGRTWQVELAYGNDAEIPTGAKLSAAELTGADAEAYVARTAETLDVASGQVTYAKALDITILKDGKAIQPKAPVSVSVKLLDAPEADDNVNINVLHFGDEVEPVECALNGDKVEFEAERFSVYVITYTVDFHWGDYTYSIEGEDSITLGALLDRLGVQEIALSDVADATFSNPEFVSVEPVDSDWRITSLAPFDTDEALVLALRNGETVEIRVTDDQETVTVTFDADNGTEPTVKTIHKGSTVDVPDEEPTKDGGFTFGGWGTVDENGTWTEFSFENTIDANITLKAKWLKNITITADSDTKVYDGTALTKDSYTNTALADGDEIESVTVTGSQTDAGTVDNVPSAAKIVNADGEDVTADYAITYVNGSLEVTRRAVTVTADDASKTFGRPDPDWNDWTAVETGLIGADTISYTFSREAGEGVGTYAIMPVGAAEQGNYAITYVNGTLEILPKNVIVTAVNKSKTYGDADPELTVRITGLLDGDGEELISYTITRAEGDEGENVGAYTITPSGEARQRYYNVMFRTGTLTITPAPVTVRAENKSKVTGAPDPEFTAVVTSLKNGDDASVIDYTLTRPDSIETNPDREKSGEHTIVVTGEEEQGNYTVEFENGILTIDKLTITFMKGEEPVRTCALELNQPIGEADDLAGVEKEGCDFEGWYAHTEEGAEKITSETTFTENTTLNAHYTVTVRFEADGVSNPDAVTLAEGTAIGTLPEVSKEGYRFDGWYYDPQFAGERATAEDAVDAHTTLYAKFVKLVTVRFERATVEADGTTTEPIADSEKIIDQGAKISADGYPAVEKPEGYAFKGWFVDDTQIDTVNHTYDADATVTARVVKQTTVTYRAEQDDGSFDVFDTDTGDVNRSISFPDPAPVLDGADFKGWYDGDTQVSNGFTANADRTLTAHYTVTVNFIVKNADYTSVSSETPVVIDKGAKLGDQLLNDPDMTGYKFKGWFIADSDGRPGETQVTADSPAFDAHTDVVAKFARQVTVVFDTEGVRHEYTVDAGDTVQLLENPVKPNARFDGWFDQNGKRVSTAEGVVDDEGNPIVDEQGNPVRKLTATEDMTLTARFIDQITVEFIVVHPETKSDSTGYPSLNSEGKFTLDKTEEGESVPEEFYAHTPNVTGYCFQGWHYITKVSDDTADYNASYGSSRFVIPNSAEDGKVYALGELACKRDETTDYPTFKEDTILVAKFAREVTITFRYDKAGQMTDPCPSIQCLAGEKLSDYYLPLEDPNNDPSAYAEGYRIEWYRGSEKVDPDYVIAESDDNAVFDARYIQQVTATFQDESGSVIQSVTQDVNTALGELPQVQETIGEGDQQRRFMGWFDEDDKQYTAETILTANVTLKAKYGYQVTFQVDGDDAWSFVRPVAPGEALGWLPGAPFREGSYFRNWMLGNDVVTAEHVVNQNETIIGYYDDVSIYTVTINYVIDGETEPTDTKILTVDRSTVTEDSPVEVSSPTSFTRDSGDYFPVMSKLLIVPDETTGLGVKDKHGDVTVDDTKPQEITITVPYKVADATYTIRYMLKNLTGNGYTQIETATVSGVIGATVYPEVREYDYADFEHSETGIIQNATGTVFHVYYTRKYFTLSYDTQGGRAVSSVTALYGTTINTLPTPEREGYDFGGWYTNLSGNTYTGRVTGSYTLSNDATLYAKWNPKTVNYTIVYMLEKYNNVTGTTAFEYDSSRTASGQVGTVVNASSAPNISGTRNGYEKDNQRNAASQITISADGSAVLQVYYKLIQYTLVFNLNNNNGRITMNGQTYTGSNYRVENVVLGQDVSSYWPSTSSEVYSVATTGNRYFRYWSGASGNYVTKRYELVWDNVSNANSNRVMTYTANWTNADNGRNAEYWLQQPDGTYKVEDSLTQIGLNTTSLGAKDIDGYTKHNGTPSGYQGSGNSTYTEQVWVEEQTIERDVTTNHGETWNNGGYTWTYSYSYRSWGITHYVYERTEPGHYETQTKTVYTYRFYYDRARYDIEYYYGATKLDTKSGILFGADISGAAYNYEPSRPADVESDYIWDGWFSDSNFTTPFTFTTMPGHNLALYTKWHAPSYTVTFHLNYDGASPEPYYVHNVEKHNTVTAGLSADEQAKLINPSPAQEHFTFTEWYTEATNGEIFDIGEKGTTITADIHLYAHWKPKDVSYTVHYYKAGTTEELLPSKTVAGNLIVGQEITEYAPYITGYNLDDEEVTMVADAGSKTIVLDYENNVIIFYYGKKPENINYTVRYVLYADKDKPAEQQTRVADDKTETISGNYTSVTETAVAPTVEAYEDYRPTKTTDTLALGTDDNLNVLTFYYTKGARVTVDWLDMEGDSVRASVETYLDVGEKYTLDDVVNGYTLDHVEKNGTATDERSFTAVSVTEEISIKAYYKKDLTILAHSANKPYDGTPLELENVPESVTVDGLKNGHTLTGITISGSRTEVGVGSCMPVPESAVITGLKNGLTAAEQFYNITCLPGALTVTKINVVISVEPDRWTGNVYDGKDKQVGFTNNGKTIGDYIIINNEAYRNAYLETIWEKLKIRLLNNGRGYKSVENALKAKKDDETPTVEGLQILKKRDAGDYYEESNVFLAAATEAIADLPNEARDNYNLILYARESRLEIGRAPLNIKTEGAEKPYDGTPLTRSDLTVTVNGAAKEPNGQSYTLAEDDTVTIQTTGRQIRPGTSQNIYEITWGEVKQENYTLSEDLGTLEVTSPPLFIEAQEMNKAFGTQDPNFTVKVYPGVMVPDIDDDGNPVLDEDGQPKSHVERNEDADEIPAALTRWGGDNYTLQLNDADRGYTDNLSIRITREEGEVPGTYAITPDWAEGAVQNYNAGFANGRLAICVARVSNDNGETWTWHQWLENDPDFYTGSNYDEATDHPSVQGAFDRARALGGDVIVETLCSNAAFANAEIQDRYTLGKKVVLTGPLDSLTLRTTTGADFTSTISRGYSGDSLFANACAFTLENITLDGDSTNFTGASDGGLVRVQTGGTLNVRPGATLRNSATSGKGNAVFVSDGAAMTMTGGSITGNNHTSGSAVEIGGAGASLTFSGDAKVYDNLTEGKQNNIHLDYDSAGVIKAAGLTSNAKIGVYVEDAVFENRGGVLDQFGTFTSSANLAAFVNDRNGLKGAARGANEIIWSQPIMVEVRYMANLLDYETMPKEAVNAYVMKPGEYLVMADIEYVPSMGKSTLTKDPSSFTIEQIERDIYENFGGSAWTGATGTMVFWRGYAGNENDFTAYLESVGSDSNAQTENYGKWSFGKYYDTSAPVDDNKLILYYTEPAYITISNDSGLDMTNQGMMVLLPGYARGNGDTETYSGPGFPNSAVLSAFDVACVTKIGDAAQPEPYAMASAQALSLANGSSVTLMIPGAVGAMYWIEGEFNDVIPEVTLISVERTGGTSASNEKIIKLNTNDIRDYPSTATPALPASQANAGSHRLYGGLTQSTILHFGEAYICKITDESGNLLRVDSKIQAFKTLEEAFKAYADNALTAYTKRDGTPATPAYIKMLVEDYDLKLGNKLASLGEYYAGMTQITVPANKPVILTTAATTDEELPGPYTGAAVTRCVINRGVCNTSMFSVPANGSFGTENIIFDGGAVFEDGVYASGKSVAANGGIVNVSANGALNVKEGTTMQNTAVGSNMFGGAVYAEGTVTVSGSSKAGKASVEFKNCYSANMDGAIHTKQSSKLNVSNATFSYCSAFDGAGAIEVSKAESTFTNCRFEYCKNNKYSDGYGAGAIRSIGNTMAVTNCEFIHCYANCQGGAIYHRPSNNSGSFTVTDTSFTECHAIDTTRGRAAGAMETQAAKVTVDRCSYTDCTATTNAGAINIYKQSGNFTVNVSNSTFTRCMASLTNSSNGYGGALRINGQDSSVITVTNCTFSDCQARCGGAISSLKGKTTIDGIKTSITDCSATSNGGGVYLSGGTLTVNAGTIKNCEAPDGGAIYQGGGTCNFQGTITDCVAKKKGNSNGRGGGVYMGGGTFNMKGGTITSSSAYSNGGGVCLNADKATFNLIGGTITRCDSLASGGGVYMGGGTFEFTGGEINRCSAKTGGGVYINGSSTVTISKDGAAIRDCKAINVTADNGTFTPAAAPSAGNNGGGLYQNGGTLKITKATIRGCSAYDGGGIYLNGNDKTALNIGEQGASNGGTVANCTASNNGGGIFQQAGTLNVYGGTSIEKNNAAKGGGIYQNGGTQVIHNGSIKSNTAKADGGGIYLGGGSFTLEDGEVGGLNANDSPNGGNEARHGGGLFVANGSSKPTEASIKGGLLGGNHATEVAGGGGIAIGGENVRLYFEGSIQVWGNTMEPNPDYPRQTTCDVCLSEDSNEIIRTTKVGLNEDSHIGVYVPDKKVSAGWLHEELHGTTGLPFGTFESSGSGDSCLERFINNRCGNGYQGYEAYYGVRKPESADPQHRIYWVAYICEITKPDGELLFTNRKATAPALYQYLGKQGAFDALNRSAKFYDVNGNEYKGTEYHVRMLVLDYDLVWEDTVSVPAKGTTIKLTMATKEDGNLPTSVRREYDKKNGIATINRGACTGSMFTTAKDSNFIIENVTIDGGAEISEDSWSKGVGATGALIQAKGDVTLNNKVLLRNSYNTRSSGSGGGGAIAFTSPGTLTMNNGAVIDHCRAADGAVVYVNASPATEANPVNIVMNTGALWQECVADNGLIHVKAGVVNLNSAFDNKKDDADTGNVSGCTVKEGGLAYVAQDGTLNVNNTVKEFTATDNGGGVYVTGGTVNLNANAAIAGCTAAKNGGGVFVANGTLNMTTAAEAPDASPAIRNCTAGLGGAIFETGASAKVNVSAGEISENTATGYGGGALRIEKKATAVISGTAEIKDNKAEGEGEKYGGAVNIKTGKLTISGGTISGNRALSTNYNMAWGGAIHADGSESKVEITGGTITGNSAGYTEGTNRTKYAYGGAVSLKNNAEMTLTGNSGNPPTITGNTVNGTQNGCGAGIYLDGNTTLHISGKPNFGGTGRKGSDAAAEIITEDDDGNPLGNFVTGTLTNKTNGQKEYKKYRQDIFVAGYLDAVGTEPDATPEPATSIVVTGPITSGAGSIWVAAEKTDNENNHYQMLKQFAVFAEDVTPDETSMLAFRNAWDDDVSGCGADYLTGQSGDALVDKNGTTWNCIYWTGGFDFLFRKIDGNGEPLDGATFTLYRADAAGTGILTNESIEGTDKRVAYQVSGKTGVKEDVTAISKTIVPGEAVTVKFQNATDATKADDVSLNGKGLAVFEKIPPGTYFMVEEVRTKAADGSYTSRTGAPKIDPDDAAADAPRYRVVEEQYKVVLDGKGCVSIYVASQDDDNKTVWTTEAPTEEIEGKCVKPAPEHNVTVKVYSLLNESPLNRKVILRKVDGADNKPLGRTSDSDADEQAKFTVYYFDRQTVVKVDGEDSEGNPIRVELKDLKSLNSGAFFVGKLPYGIYWLQETKAPKGYKTPASGSYFKLTVNADGVTIQAEGAGEESPAPGPGDGGD